MFDKLKLLLPPKRKIAAILSISFASALMLFIYTPLDIYINNPSNFIVSWRVMLLPFFTAFLLCFLVLASILVLIWHRKILVGIVLLTLCGALFVALQFALIPTYYILAAVAFAMILWVSLIKLLKEEAADVVMLIMWGVLVAAYIQTLFLNGRMVVMMGQHTEYGEISTGNILNLLIWVVIILAPLCTYMIFKLKKKTFRYEKVFVFSLAIISGMQIAGLLSSAISSDLPEGYDQEPVYFSYEGAVNFNPDENILVFKLDTLDTRIVNQAFEHYPRLWDEFDGFTYYTNNTSEYFDTLASVTSMLTRHHHLPDETGWPFIERAWNRHTIVDTLKDNGFRSNLFIDRMCSFNRFELIKDRADNIMVADGMNLHMRPFYVLTTRISLGRLSPYLLKNTWLSTISTDFSIQYFSIDVDNNTSYFIPIVGTESDMRFYRFLKQAEFSKDVEESVFLKMHFYTAHADGDKHDPTSHGYHFDEEIGEVLWGGNRFDTARGTFAILNYYFSRMKEIGVYDNSTIIILGDHGLREQYPETVALFIKPKGSIGALTVDTETELSTLYLQSSILDAAGLPYEELGVSYFDIINGLAPAPAKRTLYVPGRNAASPSARVYGEYGVWEVVGDANDIGSWSFTPMEFSEYYSFIEELNEANTR